MNKFFALLFFENPGYPGVKHIKKLKEFIHNYLSTFYVQGWTIARCHENCVCYASRALFPEDEINEIVIE